MAYERLWIGMYYDKKPRSLNYEAIITIKVDYK